MSIKIDFLFLLCAVYICSTFGIKIVPREEWGGRPPTMKHLIPGKVPFVIVHHSFKPDACYTPEDCERKMRNMQDYHQLVRKWADIGYNFAIGGDGNIYEGRGFNVVGAHAPHYNDKSIGICLIGDWMDFVPPEIMLKKTQELIDYGVSHGHITSDYKLYGHRQVTATLCPGDALYGEIQTWPHYSNQTSVF